MKRQAGILLPIFSLPNKYGIGSFGKQAYKFIDFLKSAGQKVWQILPLVQTGFGNSPYSSVCSYSFNPYFIDLDLLVEQGLLTKEEIKSSIYDGEYINYSFLYQVRYPLLRKAFSRFNRKSAPFKRFIEQKSFLDYALYMTIKENTNHQSILDWEDGLKFRKESTLEQFSKANNEQILFWQFVQYLAKTQWLNLKKYANKKGISIMGDLPYYVAHDSVDVWVNPTLYKLDENFFVKKVAGVPPDYFCELGQLWGNPVYDYSEHKKDNYAWWTNRIKRALTIYDYIRIDHFRAFDRYYEIPADAENAINGEWVEANGKDIIDAVHTQVDHSKIIAEDLGIIDDGVRDLLKHSGYPGMKILSFAFDGYDGNLYLPKNVTENSVCYTGTHDNDTLLGLLKGANENDKRNIKLGVKNSLKLLKIKGSTASDKGLLKSIIELGFACKSNLFILPMQDVMALGTEYRINEPGSVKKQNWAIRIKKVTQEKYAKELKQLTKKYHR